MHFTTDPVYNTNYVTSTFIHVTENAGDVLFI